MNENGIWNQEEADLYHKHSPKLAHFLAGYLDSNQPVYDFGCGKGYYLAVLAQYGFTCKGVEGSQLKNFLHPNISIHDLTKPFQFATRGQVLCFETLEHLPESAEETLVNSLVHSCDKKLIISWATPGQGGIGHVNLRSHEYTIKRFIDKGFNWNEDATEEIRKHVDNDCSWFERNLLVFDRI